ncbi:MAG: hypothetical protein ABJQ29_07485 [Luteolibacter sp.]
MKKSILLLVASGIFGSALVHAQDCGEVVKAVNAGVLVEDANVLEVVDAQVSESPNCACEIVKAAIVASKAEGQAVGQIVEAAGNAAPDRLDLIVDCATAVAPKSIDYIQAAAKIVKTNHADIFNPLDVPGDGGGADFIGDGLTEIPPVVNAIEVTNPNSHSNDVD